MMRTTMLSSVDNTEAMKQQADLYLHPPIERVEIFDWKAVGKLADVGYEYAVREIETWQRESPVFSDGFKVSRHP